MKKFILLGILVSFMTPAAWGVSARRKAGEKWQHLAAQPRSLNQTFRFTPRHLNDTALAKASRLKEIDFATVTDVGNTQNLMKIFTYLRDTRFVHNPESPKSQRRLSWMYPDDGCFVRAEIMSTMVEKQNWLSMKKIFIFGDLAARTRNTREGVVRWWFHVAPVLRTGNEVWVLDPSLNYERPLKVLEWKKAMEVESTSQETKNFALCEPHTFDPDDSCFKPQGFNFNGITGMQKDLQNLEWQRVIQLGRDPYKEL